MLEEQVFYFFYKMPRELRALVLMTQAVLYLKSALVYREARAL